MDTETALFYGFLVLLVLVIAVVIILLIHSGFFTEINVQTCKPCIGEITIAYKAARGPYKESGSMFTEAHTLFPQYRTIGVYYDDPKKKESSRLRYIVGLVISENGEAVNEEHKKLLIEWDYKFATFPAIQHAVQTSFPFKSTISIIVAIFRVYPILDEYIEMRSLCAHPFIEVYDNGKGEIFFIGPLEKQDNFYVPEVLESDEIGQGDDREEDHSVSWDESASYIKSEEFDSDSVNEDGHSLSDTDDNDGPKNELIPEKDDDRKTTDDSEPPSASDNLVGLDLEKPRLGADDDSDNNTGSSFEEIDEKDAPEIKQKVEEKDAPLSTESKTEL